MVRVGLIADIQYADCEDGTDFEATEQRHFRNSIEIARSAVRCWNAEPVEVVIQLGDIIDGCNVRLNASGDAMAKVLKTLDQCTASRRFDLIGNHELYNVRRENLASSGLRCFDDSGKTYYSAHLGGMWEAIFLDAYEHALIGMGDGEEGYMKARDIMQQNNPRVLDPHNRNWFDGLPEDLHRFVPYNGGASPEQVAWLEGALVAAAVAGRKVLVFSHVPLYEPATKKKTLIWNFQEIMRVLHSHKDTVVAVFAGHDHNGGYAVDGVGLHHVTMNSPLTAPVGSDCFAVLECHDSGMARFIAHGRACVESGTNGNGRAYAEIVCAKGAQNLPVEGTAILGETEKLSSVVAMGFTPEQARGALDMANGSVDGAIQLLVE